MREPESSSLPEGLGNAFAFAGLNALSFQLILSSPMILYAKKLQASATVLGIIAGMMPLLVIFQIPAASYIPRLGYKRFVLAGWGIRVLFIFAMAVVPLLQFFLDPHSQLALLLLLLFGFNLSRGISSCAWLPWISSLVPEEVRGRYLVRDAAWVNLCSFITLVIAAGTLWGSPAAWQFAALFFFSALMGAASLYFLKRIPDVPIPASSAQNPNRVPWLEISRFPPFRKLLHMNVAWAIASGGMTAFTVSFLKVMGGLPEGTILLMNSVAFLGGFCSLWFVGSRLDRFGSKPVLTFGCGLWIIITMGWLAIAATILPLRSEFILALQFLMGLGSALVSMSNTRLAMAVVPTMGRNHFFALFSVIGSLALGVAPILWGMFIDAFAWANWKWHGFEVNRYTLFFGAVILAFLGMAVFCARLEEKKARSFEELIRELLVQSPQRIWMRLWPR